MAAMSVFEFICTCTGSFGQQLVPHTDAANRLPGSHSLADIHNGFFGKIRITGAVGYEKSVKRDCVEVIVPGNANNLHPATGQTSDYIEFGTTVNKHNGLIAASMFLHLATAHFINEVFRVRVVKPHLVRRGEINLAEHRPFLTQMLCKGTRIDAI